MAAIGATSPSATEIGNGGSPHPDWPNPPIVVERLKLDPKLPFIPALAQATDAGFLIFTESRTFTVLMLGCPAETEDLRCRPSR